MKNFKAGVGIFTNAFLIFYIIAFILGVMEQYLLGTPFEILMNIALAVGRNPITILFGLCIGLIQRFYIKEKKTSSTILIVFTSLFIFSEIFAYWFVKLITG